MIFNNYSEIKDLKFDLIIIGSGPAGMSVALELEEKKISTLIIEAGKYNFSEESQKFYDGINGFYFWRFTLINRLLLFS